MKPNYILPFLMISIVGLVALFCLNPSIYILILALVLSGWTWGILDAKNKY